MCTVWSSHSNDWVSTTMNLPEILCEAWTLLWRNCSDDSEGHSCVQLVIGSFIMTTSLLLYQVLCRVFWQNIRSSRWLSPPTAHILVLYNFWLFPELTSPFKGKRFQTIDEIQENMMWQLMVIGRTVWGPKVPTLKGTEASLSYVQCFLILIFFNKGLYS